MNHKIVEKSSIGNRKFIIVVQLFPDNIIESNAIKRIEQGEATFEQNDLIDNYLLFNLNLEKYSIIRVINQKEEYFYIEVYQN